MLERHEIIRTRLVNIEGEGVAARGSTAYGTKKER
jgi:hypothetical protein